MCDSSARSCASKHNSHSRHLFTGPPIPQLYFKIIPLLFSYTSFPPVEYYLNDRFWKSLFPSSYPSENKATKIKGLERYRWYVTTFHATSPVFYSFSQVSSRWVFHFSFHFSFSLTTSPILFCSTCEYISQFGMQWYLWRYVSLPIIINFPLQFNVTNLFPFTTSFFLLFIS